MKSIFIILIILLSTSIFPQPKDPDLILEKVKNEFGKVYDYEVNVKIKVDVSFLKMPDREAKVFYKKPDKFHIDSENFALIPKSGLNFSPFGFLSSKYTAFYLREDTINNKTASVINIIPIEGNSDVILSTLWVDTQRNIIIKVESTRKPQGTYTIDLDYAKTKEGFWLPSSMLFSFTIDKSLFPGKIKKETTIQGQTDKDSNQPETGKVYLTYSDYKVNINLSDSIFEGNSDK